MGDIGNILVDIAREENSEIIDNPYCFFINKYSMNKDYKDLKNPETRFTFGDAIELLKLGYKVAREGWNEKGVYIILATASTLELVKDKSVIDDARIDNFIAMKTTQGTYQPSWLASQADIFAEDWMIIRD